MSVNRNESMQIGQISKRVGVSIDGNAANVLNFGTRPKAARSYFGRSAIAALQTACRLCRVAAPRRVASLRFHRH
jgi:hypothetical protein